MRITCIWEHAGGQVVATGYDCFLGEVLRGEPAEWAFSISHHDPVVVRVTAAAPWISGIDPGTLALSPGRAQRLHVRADTRGLRQGVPVYSPILLQREDGGQVLLQFNVSLDVVRPVGAITRVYADSRPNVALGTARILDWGGIHRVLESNLRRHPVALHNEGAQPARVAARSSAAWLCATPEVCAITGEGTEICTLSVLPDALPSPRGGQTVLDASVWFEAGEMPVDGARMVVGSVSIVREAEPVPEVTTSPLRFGTAEVGGGPRRAPLRVRNRATRPVTVRISSNHPAVVPVRPEVTLDPGSSADLEVEWAAREVDGRDLAAALEVEFSHEGETVGRRTIQAHGRARLPRAPRLPAAPLAPAITDGVEAPPPPATEAGIEEVLEGLPPVAPPRRLRIPEPVPRRRHAFGIGLWAIALALALAPGGLWVGWRLAHTGRTGSLTVVLAGRHGASSARGLAGTRVLLRGQDRLLVGYANAVGVVKFEHLEPGDYKLSAVHVSLGRMACRVDVSRSMQSLVRVQLVPAQAALVASVTERSTGRTLANARLVLRGPGRQTWSAAAGRDGRAALANLPPGKYSVRAAAAGCLADQQSVALDAGQRCLLRIALDPAPATLSVSVLAEGSKLPIQGAEVLVRGTGAQRRGRTDSGGHARIAGLSAGSYQVRAQREGFRASPARACMLEGGGMGQAQFLLARAPAAPRPDAGAREYTVEEAIPCPIRTEGVRKGREGKRPNVIHPGRPGVKVVTYRMQGGRRTILRTVIKRPPGVTEYVY